MRPLLVLSACLAVVAARPCLAQDSYELFPFTRQRATNVARMYAERLNGGLGTYRPDACMYNRGGGDCLVKGDAEGYIFRFLGGLPAGRSSTWPPRLKPRSRSQLMGAQW